MRSHSRPKWKPSPFRRVAALLLIGLAGCAGRPERAVPVAGQVWVGGRPLRLGDAVGKVWFKPDRDRGNANQVEAVGDMDAEGRYRLRAGGRDAIPPGWYRVMVVAAERVDPNRPKRARRSLVPSHVTSIATSGLSIQVAPDRPAGSYDLRLSQ